MLILALMVSSVLSVAAHNYQFMLDHKLPAGKWLDPDMRKGVEAAVAKKFGNTKPVVMAEIDYRYFLDRKAIAEQGLDYEQVKATAIEWLRQAPTTPCGIVSRTSRRLRRSSMG